MGKEFEKGLAEKIIDQVQQLQARNRTQPDLPQVSSVINMGNPLDRVRAMRQEMYRPASDSESVSEAVGYTSEIYRDSDCVSSSSAASIASPQQSFVSDAAVPSTLGKS